MKKFDILSANTRDGMKLAVNDALSQSWDLHGAMIVIRTDIYGSGDSVRRFEYIQPVIRDMTEIEMMESRK